MSRLNKNLGAADRARLADYLEDVREIERRIQQVEAVNSTGEPRELPGAPIGVPDDFAEHVKLMFDLQALAFASDTTRVFAFKMGRDASNRVYADSGYKAAFHSASHHQDRDDRITEFAKINKYHVSMVPYFLNKLKNTPDGDSNLLENTLVLYGSPMGNSNVHNHKRCPLFLAGHAGGQLKGGLHLRAADGTPMANVMLSVAHMLGMNDFKTFGDSTAAFDLNTCSGDDGGGVKHMPRTRRQDVETTRALTQSLRFGSWPSASMTMKQIVTSLALIVALSVGVNAAESPIADAAARGDREAVKSLLKKAADVNAAQGDGMTALHWAAMNGDARAGADADRRRRERPRHDAARHLHAALPRQPAGTWHR